MIRALSTPRSAGSPAAPRGKARQGSAGCADTPGSAGAGLAPVQPRCLGPVPLIRSVSRRGELRRPPVGGGGVAAATPAAPPGLCPLLLQDQVSRGRERHRLPVPACRTRGRGQRRRWEGRVLHGRGRGRAARSGQVRRQEPEPAGPCLPRCSPSAWRSSLPPSISP